MFERFFRLDTKDLFKTTDPSREDKLKLAGKLLDGLDVNKILLGLNDISRQTITDPSRFISRQELEDASQLATIKKLVFSDFLRDMHRSKVDFIFSDGGEEVYLTLKGDDYFSNVYYAFSRKFRGNISISFNDPASLNPDSNTRIELYDKRSGNPCTHSIRVQDDPFTVSLSTYNGENGVIYVESEKGRQRYSSVES